MSEPRETPEEMLLEWTNPPAGATKLWYQDRGRALEGIILAVLERDGLDPRTRFRPDGEEIDGSFVLHHRTYLLEAKWHKAPRPASDLYAFRGKVDGKLVGTVGVFISMSGYSPDAIDALKLGKEINLILFDLQDFQLVCSGRVSFDQAMDRKLRYAAEEGLPFFPLAPSAPSAPRTSEPTDVAKFSNAASAQSNRDIWDIVVEGQADGVGLGIVLERLERRDKVRIWVAGGQMAVPGLVRHLRAEKRNHVAVIIEADAPPRIVEQLRSEMSESLENLVVVGNSIEDWLEDACDVDYVNLTPPTGVKEKAARRFASSADLAKLRGGASPLSELISRIVA